MTRRGVGRCLELMRLWADGVACQGLVDNYALPVIDPTVEIGPSQVKDWLGIELTAPEIADILQRLEFKTEVKDGIVHATAPDHRLDIGTGVVGVADLLEEIARIYGYERIPETRMSDELPPQVGNPALENEERVRDLLVNLGLQEVVTYRMTSPEREHRLQPGDGPGESQGYVRIANPIAVDRNVLRRNLLASLLEVIERNARLAERIAIFEIGPVFNASADDDLPEEAPHLAIALTGQRALPGWQSNDTHSMDFYDLKGILSGLFDGLRLGEVRYVPEELPSFHPGKSARIWLGERSLGIMGELHPLVVEHYEIPETPLLAADMDMQAILASIPARYTVEPVPTYPPVLEDLAVIVDESVPAEKVAAVIQQAAGQTLSDLRLFDLYRGDQIGAAKKSLAYSLTYQSEERTLIDDEVLKIRQRIIRQLEKELGARLRS